MARKRVYGLIMVKFPHSPILHYAFGFWIEKTTKEKQYIAIGKTDLFFSSMRLCGNFTLIATIIWVCIAIMFVMESLLSKH